MLKAVIMFYTYFQKRKKKKEKKFFVIQFDFDSEKYISINKETSKERVQILKCIAIYGPLYK